MLGMVVDKLTKSSSILSQWLMSII